MELGEKRIAIGSFVGFVGVFIVRGILQLPGGAMYGWLVVEKKRKEEGT